jgi:hypothetical protein
MVLAVPIVALHTFYKEHALKGGYARSQRLDGVRDEGVPVRLGMALAPGGDTVGLVL